MTTHDTSSTVFRRTRRALTALGVPSLAVASVVMAPTAARADVPEGWSDPDPVDKLDALLLLAGGPLLLFVLICLAVFLPAMIRGERLLPDHSRPDAQWLGGPHQGAAELPAPDDAKSQAGGASGSW